MEPNATQGDQHTKLIGLTHPRVLSIAQREFIVRNGLGDREPSVRAAAGFLLGTWVDIVNIEVEAVDTKLEDGAVDKMQTDLLDLLHLFDLAENNLAADALLSIFTTRTDILDKLEFSSTSTLTVSIRAYSLLCQIIIGRP